MGKVTLFSAVFALMLSLAGMSAPATHAVDMPAAPSLVAPTNDVVVGGATLTNSWSAVPGAAEYEYQSYHDAALTQVRWTETIGGTSKTATNVANAVFWWRMRAIDANNVKGSWSESRKVTVNNTVTKKPVITSPANGQYFKSPTITATWDAATGLNGVTKYEVEYAYLQNDTLKIDRYDAGTKLTWDQALSENVQVDFTIRVRAYYRAVKGEWSDPVAYVYDSIKPEVLSITSAPHEVEEGEPIMISGTASADASTFELLFSNGDRVTGAVNEGGWSSTYNAATIGNYLVNATVTDVAGNASEATSASQTSFGVIAKSAPAIEDDDEAPADVIVPGVTDDSLLATVPTVTPTLTNTFARTLFGTPVDDLIDSGSSQEASVAPVGPAVLGAEDTKKSVVAAASKPVEVSESGWKLFGIAWFWYVVVAAGAGLLWWLVAVLQRRATRSTL